MGPKQCAPSVSEGASFADLAIFWSEVSSGCCFTNVTSRPCGIKRQAGERQKCRARARWAGAWGLLPGGIVENQEGRLGRGPVEARKTNNVLVGLISLLQKEVGVGAQCVLFTDSNEVFDRIPVFFTKSARDFGHKQHNYANIIIWLKY